MLYEIVYDRYFINENEYGDRVFSFTCQGNNVLEAIEDFRTIYQDNEDFKYRILSVEIMPYGIYEKLFSNENKDYKVYQDFMEVIRERVLIGLASYDND